MKALTLTQPWATLVAIGAKTIETRSWATKYQGDLAIHAAKGFPPECQSLFWQEPFKTLLDAAGYDWHGKLPRGMVIAKCVISDCVRTEQIASRISATEYKLGDYSVGRFAFILKSVEELPHEIARGSLGLWEWRSYRK